VEPWCQGIVALEPGARSFHCLEPGCFLAGGAGGSERFVVEPGAQGDKTKVNYFWYPVFVALVPSLVYGNRSCKILNAKCFGLNSERDAAYST